MRCPKCGSDESGKFCSKCGAEVRKKSGGAGGAKCSKCGKGLEPKAMFCAECGEPTGHRPAKGAAAYLPWVLSGLAMVAFAIALTMFIQGQTAVRVGDMPPTGALPVAERVNPDGTPVASAPNAGPGGVDLGSMSPRQAADRLFDRVMREDEAGNEAGPFLASIILDTTEPADLTLTITGTIAEGAPSTALTGSRRLGTTVRIDLIRVKRCLPVFPALLASILVRVVITRITKTVTIGVAVQRVRVLAWCIGVEWCV